MSARRPTFNGRPMRPSYCSGGCMRDFNAEDAPERSGVNGLCEECYEREELARAEDNDDRYNEAGRS